MCLATLHKKPPTTGIGYKVIAHPGYSYWGKNYPHIRPKMGLMVEDESNEWLLADNSAEYRTGFHVFMTLEGARAYTCGQSIWKVKYDKVTAAGLQLVALMDHYEEAVVARKLTFIKKEQ